MLEYYQAYADYDTVAELTRELVQEAALQATGSLVIVHPDGSEHDLGQPWASVTLFGSLSEALGRDIGPATPIEELHALADAADIPYEFGALPGKLAEELFEHHVVPSFTGPTFVRDFPVDTSPLVRDHRSEPGLVEKWDLYVDGFELATGYSELVDPVVQRARLVDQAVLASRGDAEAMQLDEDFLRALEYGMPPSGGVGMGIDRLMMALTGIRSIRETILFPLVKPR